MPSIDAPRKLKPARYDRARAQATVARYTGIIRAHDASLDFAGIRLIGFNSETAFRALLTLAAIGVVVAARLLLLAIVKTVNRTHAHDRLVTRPKGMRAPARPRARHSRPSTACSWTTPSRASTGGSRTTGWS